MIEQRQRVVAVESATQRCWAQRLTAVTEPRLRGVLEQAARELLADMAKQGHRYMAERDLHIYGPFPALTDIQMLLGGDVDESHYHRVVDACAQGGGFGLYLINGDFVVALPQKGAPEGVATNVLLAVS